MKSATVSHDCKSPPRAIFTDKSRPGHSRNSQIRHRGHHRLTMKILSPCQRNGSSNLRCHRTVDVKPRLHLSKPNRVQSAAMSRVAVACAGQSPSDLRHAVKLQVRHHQLPDFPSCRPSTRMVTRASVSLARSPSSIAASSSVSPWVVSRTTASRAARAAVAHRSPRAVNRTCTLRRSAPVRRSAKPAASS